MPSLTATETPIAALIPAGQIWKFYYFAGSQRIAMRYKDGAGSNVEGYVLTDHLPPRCASGVLREVARIRRSATAARRWAR